MKSKVLTTHVGSLPRTQQVSELIFAKENVVIEDGDKPLVKNVSQKEFDETIEKATIDIVRKQKESNVDIPSDGEMSKLSYATYIKDRLNGFEGDSPRRVPADLQDFSSFAKKIASSGGTPTYKRPQCVDKITIKTLKPLYDDIEREKHALAQAGYENGFMNSASPGVIALFQPSVYHATHQEYLQNLAEVMSKEYEAIAQAGLILQIDSPDLALGRHMMFADKSEDDFLKILDLHIEMLNEALKNIPADKIRLHLCWGNYEGPHHKDIELKKILSRIFKAKPRQLSFEAANPRHAHEWKIWQEVDIPSDYVLLPGVIDSTTNYIEHPELVAQRIENFTNIVGKDRVIASSDCGFATFAGFGKVHEQIVWAKLQSLAKGASIVNHK